MTDPQDQFHVFSEEGWGDSSRIQFVKADDEEAAKSKVVSYDEYLGTVRDFAAAMAGGEDIAGASQSPLCDRSGRITEVIDPDEIVRYSFGLRE